MKLEGKYYQLNGVELHVVEAGNPAGEVLLFLHGFPEFWWGWRKQIPYFVEKGYRVIVPDQLGYNLSSKPSGKKAYKMKFLSEDIAALIRQLTTKKVNLVGHDWGGAVAWATAMQYAELVKKLIVLNLPHPKVMRQFLKTNPKQLLKSSYIGFFQLPFLPEKTLSMFNYRMLERSMLNSSRENTFSHEELDRYKEAWRQPGALRGMLNWYRAALNGTIELDQEVTVPTLLVWGKQDQFLSEEMAQPSIDLCEDGRLEILENATHWVQHEEAEQVNELIQEFIQEQ